MKVKSNWNSPWVNLAFTVFSKFFNSHSVNVNDPVYSIMACSQVVCVHCMRDVFLISGSKKAMMQFFGVWFLKLKQQDTRVNYNKDSVIQRWAEKRKKRKKTKKSKTDDKLSLL